MLLLKMVGVVQPQAKASGSHQLEELTDSSLEPLEGARPATTLISAQ